MKRMLKYQKSDRDLFIDLAKNDFKSKYASSIWGIGWAYIQPLMNLLVMWYVFQIGLKSGNVDEVPFIVWFAPASLVWTFFSESISSTAMCMKEYNYLVSKVNFNIQTIPLVKIASGCFVHLAFIIFLLFLNFIYNINFSIYNIQILYYFLCLVVHLIGLGWIVSIITPFLPDMQSIVSVILQIGFWATPIVWNASDMSPIVHALSKLNPMYYICTGYRESLIGQVWFWEHWDTTLYYWAINILLLIFGSRIFKKLRTQIADVL